MNKSLLSFILIICLVFSCFSASANSNDYLYIYIEEADIGNVMAWTLQYPSIAIQIGVHAALAKTNAQKEVLVEKCIEIAQSNPEAFKDLVQILSNPILRELKKQKLDIKNIFELVDIIKNKKIRVLFSRNVQGQSNYNQTPYSFQQQSFGKIAIGGYVVDSKNRVVPACITIATPSGQVETVYTNQYGQWQYVATEEGVYKFEYQNINHMMYKGTEELNISRDMLRLSGSMVKNLVIWSMR